jgi:isochorismate pyruvate lyase
MNIEQVRRNIDQLDTMIVALLAKRTDLVAVAARLKKSEQAVRDPRRVEQVIAGVRQKAERSGLDPDIAEKTYRTLIDCLVQKELTLFRKDG